MASTSILFQLGALSNSRETQHFNKISHLDRSEHSPRLQLIKTSDIDPYPVPSESFLQNASSSPAPPVLRQRPFHREPAWDAKALAAGRAVLADTMRQRSHMARKVRRARTRETTAKRLLGVQTAALAMEKQRMREEMRSAGFLILLAVAAATGCATWAFWPAGRTRAGGEVGERVTETASVSDGVAGGGTAVAVGGEPVGPGAVMEEAAAGLKEETARKPGASWGWKSLFWKV